MMGIMAKIDIMRLENVEKDRRGANILFTISRVEQATRGCIRNSFA